MRAENWKFKKYISDMEDMDALIKIHRQFFVDSNTDYRDGMNEAELANHCFIAGFIRGIDWANNKNKEDG